MPFLAILVVVALGAGFLQAGFLFSAEPVTPKLERLDPAAGFGKIFSLRGFVRVATALLKLLAIIAVVGFTIWNERVLLLALPNRELPEIAHRILELSFLVSMRTVIALLILAALDYGVQRIQYERELRMSRREVKEELKRYEGDPKIRERRRAIQRQIGLQRMIHLVPEASVVIANLTEVAVALKYEPERMAAPMLVAKGIASLAQRICETALEHGVPVVERPDLARAIHRRVEVSGPIPGDLYPGAAEVLAYVDRVKKLPQAG